MKNYKIEEGVIFKTVIVENEITSEVSIEQLRNTIEDCKKQIEFLESLIKETEQEIKEISEL